MRIEPLDEHNRVLLQNVHPDDWINPVPKPFYHLVVIGAGTAGLVTAAGAAALGAKVALIEKHLMGGDCLNTGCVPSKTFIRSSRTAAEIKRSQKYGIRIRDTYAVDFAAVMERVRKIRAEISSHDSARRFQQLGVDVFLGEAHFEKPGKILVDGVDLNYRKAVIATGSRPTVPPIEGLNEAGYLTNETVFSLTEPPQSLAVIGGGPLGCELAQAFARFGIETHIFHNKNHILDREDPDAAAILQKRFQQEGILLHLNSKVEGVEKIAAGKAIKYQDDQGTQSISVGEILFGTGRKANIEGLRLQTVGVEYHPEKGVIIDDFMKTTNPNIYAAGDVCMEWKFTHAAEAAARIVLQNALFHFRKRLSSLTMPWCTYTDPEIAHVGMYEREAKAKGISSEVFLRTFDEEDRAITDGEQEGLIKIHVRKGTDKILGATIVAAHAGEMISEITLAIVSNLGLKGISSVIHPYPTQTESIRHIADDYNKTRLTPRIKRMLQLWFKLR